MSLAINLAMNNKSLIKGNPSVGCVIVSKNDIVAQAKTSIDGKKHAEYLAINSLKDNFADKELELYTTLEPCFVRSSPVDISCVDEILRFGIKKVFIGTLDPNPLIKGKGVKKLLDNNVKVFMAKEEQKKRCEELVKDFALIFSKQRPYVTLKIAMSLDGKIALHNKKSKWITSAKQRQLGHKLRANSDAILTGIDTVLADDPMLNVRLEDVSITPIRVILDSNLRLPIDSCIYKTSKDIKTIIFTAKKRVINNIEIIEVARCDQGLNLRHVLQILKERGISRVLVEAGQKINTSFIKQNLVDEIVVFQSNKIIGADGVNAIGELGVMKISECKSFKTRIVSES